MGRGTLAISILDISIKLYVLFMLQKEYISLSACPNEFMQCQNTCFFLNNNTMSWDEAQHACIQLDARSHLLLLNHKQKDQNIRRCLLHSFLGHTELWIDGIYNGRQKCWIWASNQSALQYQAFPEEQSLMMQNGNA